MNSMLLIILQEYENKKIVCLYSCSVIVVQQGHHLEAPVFTGVCVFM